MEVLGGFIVVVLDIDHIMGGGLDWSPHENQIEL
jgi:hypothetical protein